MRYCGVREDFILYNITRMANSLCFLIVKNKLFYLFSFEMFLLAVAPVISLMACILICSSLSNSQSKDPPHTTFPYAIIGKTNDE